MMADNTPDPTTGITGPSDGAPRRLARPALPPGARPAAPRPVPSPVKAPSAPAAVPAPARPAGPARPAVPPQLKPAVSPEAAPAADQAPEFATYEDDSVIIQESDVASAVSGPAAPARSQPRTPYLGSLKVRRTIIPILLTVGAMLILAAIVRRFASEDAPLSMIPSWISVVGMIAGIALLGVAFLNMLQVRSELARANAH